MDLPGPAHFLFIPGVMMIGIVIGWILGGNSARAELEKRRKRMRE
jgi:ABC-type dipeptide/oligopeptide/nickel transport system permease subunit